MLAPVDAEIIRLYQEGKSLKEIGVSIYWSKSAVRRRLVALGVPLRPRGGNKRTPTTVDDDEIVLLYENGYSTEDVGKMLNWSRSYVSSRLRALNVPLRSPGGGYSKIERSELDKVAFLYQNLGLSMSEVADQLGITESAVRHRLIVAGIPRRTKSEVATNQRKKKRDRVDVLSPV